MTSRASSWESGTLPRGQSGLPDVQLSELSDGHGSRYLDSRTLEPMQFDVLLSHQKQVLSEPSNRSFSSRTCHICLYVNSGTRLSSYRRGSPIESLALEDVE